MPVTMRQLLGRKGNPRLPEQHTPDGEPSASQPARGLVGERVFPLRNTRGNTKTDASKFDNDHEEYTRFPIPTRALTPQSQRSTGTQDSDEKRKVSDRSHFISANSEPPRVLTGVIASDGNVAYRRCEDEPIQTPGAIQSFGALLGLKYTNSGDLEVRIASENTRKVLGYGPEQLFALPSFLDVLKHDVRDEMVARIKHALNNPDARNQETRLDVFQMVLTFPYEPDLRLWCAIHLAPGPEGLVICEFEDYSDAFNLKSVETAKILPVAPISLIDFDISPEEFKKSTTRASKPLEVLEIAHQTQNKKFSSLDLFNAMGQAQHQISESKSVQPLLEVLVGIISELTGFHRVMVYRFDSQKNGCVDAELLNPHACTDIFRGMHFPASDIPKQARELYKINRIRILHDRGAETARLVCRNERDFERPLDLTHSYLRAVSPVHKKYLANMGVRSTMSISIVINSELWGLIACHGYGDVGMRVSLPIRELCRSIGECAGVHIQRLNMQQRVDARRPSPNVNASSGNPASFIAASSADLLKLVDADFALLSIEDKTRAIGKLDPYREAIAILSYLQSCRFTKLRCTTNINADFPGLSYAPGLKSICGLLLIPLSIGEGNDFLVFFRKAQRKHVKWAGNPYEKTFKAHSEYLEPRKSFQRWVETIEGTSREWTDDQLDTASTLGMLYAQYGRFKLTEAEDSHVQAIDGTFNLNRTVSKLKDQLQKDAQRKGVDLTVSILKQLPAMVKGEPDRLRELITYFTNNAFKQSPSVRVVIDLVGTKEETSMIGLSFQDDGTAMSEEQLDDTFHKFGEAQDEENWQLPVKEASTNLSNAKRDKVDLAVVARYVRDLNGQIRVTSEQGHGNTFSVELLFQHVPPPTNKAKPRKLRDIFLPSVGLSKTPTPSTTPITKSPGPNQNEFQRAPPTPTPTEGSFSPRVHIHQLEEDHDATQDAYAHGSDRYNGEEHWPLAGMDDTDDVGSSVPLNVLIAEDNPISLKMLDKRLSLRGHTVVVAHDGQKCHDLFAANPLKFDVILMDLKMPSVNGVLSTRMIRSLEKELKHANQYKSGHSGDSQSSSHSSSHRIPIIAVSTSLYEENKLDYIQNGFDGWILKPVDFKKLELVLEGIKNPKLRRKLLHIPGQWEQGGWLIA